MMFRRSNSVALAWAMIVFLCGVPSAASSQNAEGIEVLGAGAVEEPLAESATLMARLGVPMEPLLANQKIVNDRVFAIEMRNNPEEAAILGREPGLLANIKKAKDRAILQQMQSDYPALIDNLAILYDRVFTNAQRAELIRFYETSSGKAWILSSIAPADSTVLQAMMNDADGTLEKAEMDQILGDFRERALKRLSPEDQSNVTQFLTSDIGIAAQTHFGEEDRITLNWINSVNAKLGPLVTETIILAVNSHLNSRR